MEVTLLGHVLGAEGRTARFAADLGETVAWSDERNSKFMERVRRLVAARGLPPLEIGEPERFSAEAPERLDLRGFGAVVFAGGFGRTTNRGCPVRTPSTSSASRYRKTARAR